MPTFIGRRRSLMDKTRRAKTEIGGSTPPGAHQLSIPGKPPWSTLGAYDLRRTRPIDAFQLPVEANGWLHVNALGP